VRNHFQKKFHRALQSTLQISQAPVLTAFKAIRESVPQLDGEGKIKFPQL
jgi:hypothetical protein